MIETYKNELESCCSIFKDYAENNLADNPLHKVVSARKLSVLRTLLDQDDEHEKLKQIFNHFGLETQLQKLIEECGELIQAICKRDEENMLEEIADIEVLISQFKLIFPEYTSRISEIRRMKIERTIGRINNDNKLRKN